MMLRVPASDPTAAYFALAGALGGAGLTLVGALLSSRAQAKRLKRQLEHQRAADDRAELRGLLDEAASASWKVFVASAKLFGSVENLADHLLEVEGKERNARKAKAIPRVADYQSQAFISAWDLVTLEGRIAVRIGRTHPVTKALETLAETAHRAAKFDQEKLESFGDDFDFNNVAGQLLRERSAFIDQCHAYLSEPLQS